ncbi:3-hydroxyisobutyrate dehydrogenase, mitochondrial-like [Physella acuta]|uniref:3-hydroxyisobutyrate dehydrogenase, mitochondrial-like n=1 Tax=Physella acuta TaxID=109671 RepID=UPI0027DCB918|nr:3-hydroxyisobutyrate dehydrogenase, mitochondrial-like [Physella acuta]
MVILRQLTSVSLVIRNAAVRNFSCSSRFQAEESPVGFVGLGNMGGHMARNLLKKGYPVVAFDVSKSSLDALKSDGASIANSPAEVAANVSRLVSMLPASAEVQEVYTGKNGILSTVKKGTLLLDSSTIDPSVSQEVAAKAQKIGAVFMDSPVSGGVNAARDGVLTFMVGGPESSFEQAKALLDNMGKNVVYCGPVGTGQAAKICNNMLLAISMIGTSETMNLGIRLGLDPKLLAKILNMSSGRCWSSEVYNPVPGVVAGVPSSNDYKGGFGSALMAKDLGLAQNAATTTKSPTPLGSLAHQIYRTMCNHGYSGKDFSSAFLFLQDQDKKK